MPNFFIKIKIMKTIFLLAITVIVLMCGCQNCNETETALIEFGLIPQGDVIVYSWQSKLNVTSEWEGLGINIMMNKVYCNGKINGPFELGYTIDKYGDMTREAIGYYSFKMDNTEDYMSLKFFCGGNSIGYSTLEYGKLAAFNGQNYLPVYDIEIFWDYVNNELHSATVKLYGKK